MTEVESALLDQYSKSIDAMLGSRKLTKQDRMILETQRLFVVFMRAFQDDRVKVETMWRTYQVGYRLLWLAIPLILADVVMRLYSLLYPVLQQ